MVSERTALRLLDVDRAPLEDQAGIIRRFTAEWRHDGARWEALPGGEHGAVARKVRQLWAASEARRRGATRQ